MPPGLIAAVFFALSFGSAPGQADPHAGHAAYLDGKALDMTDKQKKLYERYRNRPKPVDGRR